MKQTSRQMSAACREANEVLTLVGDKWSVRVVMILGGGRLRFTEIKMALEGISQKMLTSTLRGLERDGFISRTVHPTIPPRVDYELTDLGRELRVQLQSLGRWAMTNARQVASARAAFEQRLEKSS